MRNSQLCAGLLLAVTCFLPITTFAANKVPAAAGHVNDFAGIIDDAKQKEIEDSLKAFEQQTGAEIAVVTIQSLDGGNIEDTAVEVFKQYGIGKKDKDNGVLLLVVLDDRKVRIEVGYGLEGDIPDGVVGEIIRKDVTPEFKKGNYQSGVENGVKRIQESVQKSGVAAGYSGKDSESDSGIIGGILTFGFFGFLIVPYIVAFLARSKSFWAGGVAGGVTGFGVTALVLQSALFGLLGAIVLGLLGLLLDFVLSKNYDKLKKLGKDTGFTHSAGGFWWGGSGGNNSGGFGGFGGGSSGGGGASGSW